MRRKSERNKSKGSPEKKVEKATRKSTRRRGKRATSSSPEREIAEVKPVESVKSEEVEKAAEISAQPATRLKIKELKTIADEELSAKLITSTAPEPAVGGEKGLLEGGEGASVWKVARADASPGEIQKLKLCRQRNASEASDSSSSRKKSHKSYESGEGDGEEGDSADDAPTSGNKELGYSRQDDPSSSTNQGRDSKEEVSHCSETLPRTTSSSSSAKLCFLSDDKNADPTAGQAELASSERDSPPLKKPEENRQEPSYNGDDSIKPEAAIKEEGITEIEKARETESTERLDDKKICKEEPEPLAQQPDEPEDKKEGDTGLKESASSAGEEKFKGENDQPLAEAKTQPKRTEIRTSSRNLRRKHRSKYHESSDSDTPESDDEPATKKSEETNVAESKEPPKTKSRSSSPQDRLAFDAGEIVAEDKASPSKDASEDRAEDSEEKKGEEISGAARVADYKPAKVNLKRSFSARLAEAEEPPKKEEAEKNGEAETTLQVKENRDGATEERDVKNFASRKRRWGTSVTVEAVPAFTVSTDSLKALVPGAKPLSINEVRLSKDEDEEKARRKDREKRHSVSDDPGDQKTREEGAPARNSESSKKADSKHDNHIGAKRKISILKDAPRVKSPSPPSAKATEVLLIKNLVRPFTLNQIKELLSRTGTIVENGFWIDGIKSKCYVVYSNEDQAFETRQALHGISWPVSNPKRLHVEYATKEDMDLARELSKDQPVIRKTEPLLGNDNWQQVWAREEKQTAAAKVTTVREWDLGKEDGGHQGKDKEREKKDLDKKRRQRSRSPAVEPHLPPPARKFKKKEDEPPPAKLLDDLFKKTRAIPCIYWLPLTNEQIVVKEEMRRQHMAEHARRLEEMKRAERSRDPAARRRRSPRK